MVDKEMSDGLELDDAAPWVLILYMLVQAREYKRASEDWAQFLDSIRNGNRFFPVARVIDNISAHLDDCTTIVSKGKALIRARKTRLEETATFFALKSASETISENNRVDSNHFQHEFAWEDALFTLLVTSEL